MAEALDVAKYIINTADGGVENLKLQKLLYYSQAVRLVLSEGKETLFDEPIEAWMYGPVVPCVYHHFKYNDFNKIPLVPDDDIVLSEKDMEAIDIAVAFYSGFTGSELINRTHQEAPWKDNYDANKRHIIIPTDQIYNYFKNKFKFTDV